MKFAEFKKFFAKQLREMRGRLTQAQLAYITKYTQQMVSRYESGRIPKAYWFLYGLARAGVGLNKLFLGRKQKPMTHRRMKQALRNRGHWT